MKKILLLFIVFFCLLFIDASFIYSQTKQAPIKPKPQQQQKITPTKPKVNQHSQSNIKKDKYRALDNSKALKELTDEMIATTIEISRQYYEKGLIYQNGGDTANAVNQYNLAFTALEKIESLPDINDNEDYTALVSAILQEYRTALKRGYGSTTTDMNNKEILFDTADQVRDYTDSLGDSTLQDIAKTSKATRSIKDMGDTDLSPEAEAAITEQMNLLLGNLRRYIIGWFELSTRWFPMMEQIAKDEGIPKDILVLSCIESGLNPKARSKAEAIGLWQFMYPTGLDYDLNKRQSIYVDERRDPVKSTRAAMRYLKDLHNAFNDWGLALAAYNWGWGNVQKAIRRVNIENPNFWDIRDEKSVKMPKATQKYVPMFFALKRIMADPKKYGIDTDTLRYTPEFKSDVVELPQATNLSAIASITGVGMEDIRELNPELLYDITPPGYRVYWLRVPVGSAKDFKRKYEQLSPEAKQPSLDHRVAQGETIVSVAERFDVSLDELIMLNGLPRNNINLQQNTNIKIPIGGKDFASSTLMLSQGDLISKKDALSENSNYYIPAVDETIYVVSEKTKISSCNLRNWNNIPVEQDTLKQGVPIIINWLEAERVNKAAEKVQNVVQNTSNSTQTKATTTANKSVSTAIHKVQQGETIFGIAKKYGMTETGLRELNAAQIKNDNIAVGSTLIVNKIDTTAKKKDTLQTKTPTINNDKTKYHTVKSGETLSDIADKYNTTISAITKLNKKLTPHKIRVGQKIRIK